MPRFFLQMLSSSTASDAATSYQARSKKRKFESNGPHQVPQNATMNDKENNLSDVKELQNLNTPKALDHLSSVFCKQRNFKETVKLMEERNKHETNLFTMT